MHKLTIYTSIFCLTLFSKSVLGQDTNSNISTDKLLTNSNLSCIYCDSIILEYTNPRKNVILTRGSLIKIKNVSHRFVIDSVSGNTLFLVPLKSKFQDTTYLLSEGAIIKYTKSKKGEFGKRKGRAFVITGYIILPLAAAWAALQHALEADLWINAVQVGPPAAVGVIAITDVSTKRINLSNPKWKINY